MSPSRIARDLRDLCSAASLSLSFFGAPVALSLMMLAEPPPVTLVVGGDVGAREAVFQVVLPAPVEADPAQGRIDGVAAVVEAPAPTPTEPEPVEPPVEERVSPEPVAEAAGPVGDGATADVLAQAGEGRPGTARLSPVDPRRVKVIREGGGAPPVASSPPAKKRRCAEPTADIRKVDDQSFEIARRLVDTYVNDLELAQTLAWVGWNRNAEGKIDGFRVKRIRCGSVLDQAGFRNNDVVHSVNGKKIRTVFGAIAAYRRLKNKEILRVDVTSEQGEERTMRYRILDEWPAVPVNG